MVKKKIIGIGEILWDLLPSGRQLGGAPANFTWHASQLGAHGIIISAVGEDEAGRDILKALKNKGLDNVIALTDYPTGTVSVNLFEGVPQYAIHENVAWDYLELNRVARKFLSGADAICFGSLAQRSEISREKIHEALDLVPPECLKVCDLNLRQDFYDQKVIELSLKHADVLKINDEEMAELKVIFRLEGDDLTLSRHFIRQYNLTMVALTRGKSPSMLVSSTEYSEMKTPDVIVADTVGAGDSFTAAITMGLLEHMTLEKLHEKAVNVSAFVCSRSGAMPVLPENFI